MNLIQRDGRPDWQVTLDAKGKVHDWSRALSEGMHRIVMEMLNGHTKSESLTLLFEHFKDTKEHFDAAMETYLWMLRGDELRERLPKLEAEAKRCKQLREGLPHA